MSGRGKGCGGRGKYQGNHLSSTNQEKKVKKKKRRNLYLNGYTTLDQPNKPLITKL